MARVLLVGRRNAFEQLLIPRLAGHDLSQCSDPSSVPGQIQRGNIKHIVVDDLMPNDGLEVIRRAAGTDIPMTVINPANQAQVEHVVTHLKGGS